MESYSESDEINNFLIENQVYSEMVAQKRLFINEGEALTYVKLQQEAQESQHKIAMSKIATQEYSRLENSNTKSADRKISSQFSSKFWINSLEENDDFFKVLAYEAILFKKNTSKYFIKNVKVKQNSTNNDDLLIAENELTACVSKLFEFYEQIREFPIAIMLMPFLFTKYITEGGTYDTIYPRMKYNRSKLPRNSLADDYKKEIESLYSKIESLFSSVLSGTPEFLSATKGLYSKNHCNRSNAKVIISQIQKAKRTRTPLVLPIFSLDCIVEKLHSLDIFQSSSNYLSKQDIANDLINYTCKNGPSTRDNDFKVGPIEEVDLDVEKNKDKKVISSVAKLCNAQVFSYFKCGYIKNHNVKHAIDHLTKERFLTSPSMDELHDKEYLDLYKEFCNICEVQERHLSRLALHKYFRIPASPQTLSHISFFECLITNFRNSFNIITQTVIKEFNEVSILTSAQLKLKNNFLQVFSKNFSRDDFESFISDVSNFTYKGFEQYLVKFCEVKKISVYKEIPLHWKSEILTTLFEDTLKLIGSMIFDDIIIYCNDQLEKYVYQDVI